MVGVALIEDEGAVAGRIAVGPGEAQVHGTGAAEQAGRARFAEAVDGQAEESGDVDAFLVQAEAVGVSVINTERTECGAAGRVDAIAVAEALVQAPEAAQGAAGLVQLGAGGEVEVYRVAAQADAAAAAAAPHRIGGGATRRAARRAGEGAENALRRGAAAQAAHQPTAAGGAGKLAAGVVAMDLDAVAAGRADAVGHRGGQRHGGGVEITG